MPVQVFSRSDPNRMNNQAKWYDQIRYDHLRLTPGQPGMRIKTEKERLAAGVHEIVLPERGIVQLCKSCRKGTRDSLWVCRCGPCGEQFSPVLNLFNSCDACGGPSSALGQLGDHLSQWHGIESGR